MNGIHSIFMHRKIIFFSIVSFFMSVLSAGSSHGILTLNYPPDKAVMEFDLLSVSLGVPRDSADLIAVFVNDEEMLQIKPDSEFECFSLSLSYGTNTIKIHAFKKKQQVDEILFSVFRRSDLVGEHRKAPAGFEKDYFHSRYHLQCIECHTLEPNESDRKPVSLASFSAETSPQDRKELTAGSTCYSCHNKITSYPFVHGPASVWSCLSCHNPEAKPVYSVKKPDSEVCFNCHAEQKKDWGSKKYVHGPVNLGKCAICHHPHASDNPFNLFKPTWELCVSCHADKATGRHVLVGYIHEGHPTRGVPDPIRKGKELTCASCHNPHVSHYPNLWAFNVETLFELCKKCHQY
jgi:predicted CXXCH cytochrome family protein